MASFAPPPNTCGRSEDDRLVVMSTDRLSWRSEMTLKSSSPPCRSKGKRNPQIQQLRSLRSAGLSAISLKVIPAGMSALVNPADRYGSGMPL